VLSSLAGVLGILIILASAAGAFRIEPLQVIEIITRLPLDSGVSTQQAAVLMNIRLPRVLLGAALGAGLAVTGAMLQGLFRNPLADPGLVGVTGGAALAAAAVIVLGVTVLPGASKSLGLFTLPLAAFAGGIFATVLVHRLATRDGITLLPMMLLAGIAVNAIAGAGIGVLTYLATDEQLRNITFWLLGSLAPANWNVLAIAAPGVTVTLIAGWLLAPRLNALLLGEAEAGHLGANVQQLKALVIAVSALSAGVLVAFCGMVGFIGLVAPHCIRLLCGPDHRVLIPGSALLGAALVVGADLVARTAFAPAEMLLGILTALIGAPFFLILLLSQRKAWGL
jgi:iron complex transport system permease protein